MRGDAREVERVSGLNLICTSVCTWPEMLSNFTF